MTTFTTWFDLVGGVATLAGMAMVIGFLAVLFVPRMPGARAIREAIHRYHVLAGFLLSTMAMVATLVYSEVIGFVPCEFCWLQRIALYPLSVIFGVALIRKELTEYLVPLVLSLIGMILAAIHIGIQLSEDSIFCVPGTVTCSTIYVTEFGFITLPVMALTVFSLLALVSVHGLLWSRD
ncbi:MAG: disulfide bond formation protein B [Candidatus Paceibacterota bacterium]